MPRSAFALVAIAMPLALAEPATAGGYPSTDANVITAIDVSGSIMARDERLEFEGMAAAVLDPEFLSAVARGPNGRIGFAAFTWANGEFLTLVPWQTISSEAEAQEVATQLRTARREEVSHSDMWAYERPWESGQATDVSLALEHAIALGESAPFTSHRNIINICANGVDNVGGEPTAARDQAWHKGFIVNAVVLGDHPESSEIATYYRSHVQVGPGSFVIEARKFEDITKAMLTKFVLELAGDARSRSPHRLESCGSQARCQMPDAG